MTRRPLVLVLVAVAALALSLAVLRAMPGTTAQASHPRPEGAITTTAARTGGVSATPPASPPARICGAASLRGPARPPKGAVVVHPHQQLDAVVARHRAGTTFWLASGRYVLRGGGFAQVDPKDHDRIIGGPHVVLDGRRIDHYAFGGTARGVRLEHLIVVNFGISLTDDQSEGVVNHDAGHHWSMSALSVRNNGGAGVFLGTGDVVRDSCLARNGQYGFSAYAPRGVRDLRLVHNEITGNNTADWERREPGCGCSGGGKFWHVRTATVRDNWVHNNRGVGLWADTDNVGFLFEGNYVAGNTDVGIDYEISYNAQIVGNTFVRNALVDGPRDGFPQPALYISESGSDPRAGSRFGTQFLISHNRFVDNYSGVVLWENANRFESSPDNSSSTDRTLVDPKATLSACRAHIAEKPYYDDCRWKTQNVLVTHNTFRIDPSAMPSTCRTADGCGYVGLFSQWGSDPSWSPYQGTVVEKHITDDQHNQFRANRYIGPWHYMLRELGRSVSWGTWRAEPTRLDAGSTLQRSDR